MSNGVMMSQDAFKTFIAEEYQYRYLYEWLCYPLFVALVVSTLIIVMKIINEMKQNAALQHLEIMIAASYIALTVSTAELLFLVTYSIFRLEINTSLIICIIFIFKLSLSSSTLYLFMVLFGGFYSRNHGFYINRKRVYICIIVAWIISIIPAVFAPLNIILIVLLGISFPCLLTRVFGTSNGFVISKNITTV